MIKLSPFLIASAVFLFSCSDKPDSISNIHSDPPTIDSLPSPQLTILADLPDSLQPRTVYLAEAPPPSRIVIPTEKEDGRTYYAGAGRLDMSPPEPVLLPTLKSQEGQTIFDKKGKPYILGNGGFSNFTTFNTDDGLPSTTY